MSHFVLMIVIVLEILNFGYEHEHEYGQELPRAAPGVMVWFR